MNQSAASEIDRPDPPDRLVLFGLPLNNVSMDEAIRRIDQYIISATPHMVFTANVAMLVQWRRSVLIRRIYRDTDLLTIDGMALTYASHLLRTPARAAVSGSLLFFEVMSLARAKGYSVFLLGAETEVLWEARRQLAKSYGSVRIAGMHNGYFGREQDLAVARLIRAAKPDILLVGMSSPLKEQFAWRYRYQMRVPVILGVGGMFDIIAGRRRLAPSWVRALCLEWLWRLIQEPRRLGWRYATTNTIFLCWLGREIIRRQIFARVGRRRGHPGDGGAK